MRIEDRLPEVTLLYDARGTRPENAAGIGGFWYEPEIWALPLSPAARILYAGLCSFLERGQIDRRDLRGSLEGRADGEITAALKVLVRHNLLAPAAGESLPGYAVRSVKEFEG